MAISSTKSAKVTTAPLAERIDFLEDAIVRLIRKSQDQQEQLTELHRTANAQGALISALADLVMSDKRSTKPRQRGQLPEGWSVIENSGKPARSRRQRPVLTVVAS